MGLKWPVIDLQIKVGGLWGCFRRDQLDELVVFWIIMYIILYYICTDLHQFAIIQWQRTSHLPASNINPLTSRAFCQKCVVFFTFWRFSGWIWAKLASIYSKRHSQHVSMPFSPSHITTFLRGQGQENDLFIFVFFLNLLLVVCWLIVDRPVIVQGIYCSVL